MNTKRLTFALCFALVCSGLLTWELSRRLPRGSTFEHTPAKRQIVVAAKDIHEGDALSNAVLAIVTLPASQQLTGTFQNTTEVSGRTVQVSISSGEPIFAHDLAPAAAGAGLAVAIPPGMRAVSVHALEESGLNSEFVLPGSRVDLLVTYRSNEDDAFVSSMVLQDVRVLAVGQNKEVGAEDRQPYGGITLLLTPEEVARLMAASSLGKVTLALRNGADRTTSAGLLRIKSTGATETQPNLRPVQKKRYSAEQQIIPEFKVETLVGGKAMVQSFRGEQ